MPKEPTSRQFRKGTKSCVECRQRKLRCIPAEDESQPCQNCESRGRKCVLQVNIGRSSDAIGVTSRDRISQLEHNVEDLWSVVQELRTELDHAQSEPAQSDRPQADRTAGDDDSDTSSISPMNPPTHLQQLFDNEFLDSLGNDGRSSDISSDKTSTAGMTRARKRLQALMPPKEDVRAIFTPAANWIFLYNAMFPTVHMFTGATEMLARYESLQDPYANPVSIASLLLSIAITVVQKPPETSYGLTAIKDTALFVREVTTSVEEEIVSNDSVAGTIEGIETSLLYIRLQLVRTQTRKLWLMLRRVIALAELIGLPRAAQRAGFPESQSPYYSDLLRSGSRLEAGAVLWKSICTIDRVVGMMFNLPLGTVAYPFPLPSTFVSDGKVVPQEYLCHLSNIGVRVQEIDDAYLSQRPDTELLEKVFQADQELRALGNRTPQSWWVLTADSPIPDQILQYWYHYWTVRAHLQLALRNRTDDQHTYSYLACSQACRAMAVRYSKLRNILPHGFFAGRILDLQALTAAVFLLYNSQKPSSKQGLSIGDEGDQPSTMLVEQVLHMMDSVPNGPGDDFGRQGAKAIRALRDLLNRSGQSSSHNLTLRIPMLGKISVNRHSTTNPAIQQQSPSYSFDEPQIPANVVPTQQFTPSAQSTASNAAFNVPGMDSSGLLSWSMDLMLDDFPPFADEGFGPDQWLSFNGYTTDGQPWS